MNRRLSLHGFGLLTLAMWAQLVLGAWVPAAMPAFAPLGVICHTGGGSGVPPPAPHHGPNDCLLCPLCATLAAPTAILVPAPTIAPPRIVAIEPAAILPPATAPPVRAPDAAQPRGPPIQA